MRLDIEQPRLETSPDLTGKLFGLKNFGMMFDMLRNKMYSDPIAAICREISCNARDAHREVGKPNLPIQIGMPNALSPVYTVKDFGPGISPERMENVFMIYMESTKRDDNNQTGGFGLGAKSPFAYTDTFSITTVVDGIKRNYTAVIDETRTGKMFLLDEELTNECNGTTISIPVKPQDWQRFLTKTIQAVKYWKVKPEITGVYPVPKIESDANLELFISGTDWKLYYDSQFNNKAIALIDDIPYDIHDQRMVLAENYDNITSGLLDQHLIISFPIGELSLVPSRETLHFDDKTIKAIKKKLASIVSEFKNNINEKLKKAETLTAAEQILTEISRRYSYVLKNMDNTWNGIKLKGMSRIDPSNKSGALIKSYRMGYRNNERCLRRTKTNELVLFKNNPIYEMDLEKAFIPNSTIEKLLKDNSQYETIQVIKFPSESSRKYWEDNLDYNKLNINLLSAAPKSTQEPREKVTYTRRDDFDAYEFNSHVYSNILDSWNKTSIKKDGSGEGVYIDIENIRTGSYSFGTIKNIGLDTLQTIRKFIHPHRIYAIHSKNICRLQSGWIPLEKILLDTFNTKLDNRKFEEIQKEITDEHFIFENKLSKVHRTIKSSLEEKDLFLTDSLFLKYFTDSEMIQKNLEDNIAIITIANLLGHKPSDKNKNNSNLEKLWHKIKKMYPLLHLSNSSYETDSLDFKSVIINYINLVDKAATV